METTVRSEPGLLLLLSCSFATLWTVAHQAPLSMGFSRQEYWSWLSFPSPGNLPDPGIEPSAPAATPALQSDSLPGKPIGTRAFSKRIQLTSNSGRDGLKSGGNKCPDLTHLPSPPAGSSHGANQLEAREQDSGSAQTS